VPSSGANARALGGIGGVDGVPPAPDEDELHADRSHSGRCKIAALVARGDSTPDIARSMFLSRRTVQTYISRILAKLGAKGRVEIVREALRHGISP